jgi:sugar lactone lactonase YvrE
MKRWFYGLVILVLLANAVGQSRSDSIYWNDLDGGTIWRANLDGSGQQLLVSGLRGPSGLTLDLAGGEMYWSYGYQQPIGGIQSANLDGSGMTPLVEGLDAPTDIVLDVLGGQMYWTFGTLNPPGGIQRANLDGSELTTLVSGLNSARGITLDLPNGKIYVTEGRSGTGTIRRYNLDGSGEEILLTDLAMPSGIALDVPGGKVYFADISSCTIQRANLDGSGQELLISRPGMGIPGIALDLAGGKIYWTEYNSGKIERANLDGSAAETVLAGLAGPDAIVLQIDRAPGKRLQLTAASTAVAGVPFDITVTALDPSGNIDPMYQGTVTFSSTDSDSGVVLPADYTFTTGDGKDNGVHTFNSAVTLVTLGDRTVTATDAASGFAVSVTITVGPGP